MNADLDKTVEVDEVARQVLSHCLRIRTLDASDPIVNIATPEEIRVIKEKAQPTQYGKDLASILSDATSIFSKRVAMDHPAFFGFIPSPASTMSWIGDILNNAYNPHCGSWYQSSGPSAVESTLISWFAKQCGFQNTDCVGGCFVSGGSMANLLACTVARDQKLGASWEERSKGRIYISMQTHSSVAKGLRILGFEEKQIVKIVCTADFRMDVQQLESAIAADAEAGLVPFLVVTNFGTTNTGTVDDLKAVRLIADRYGLWLHADGAYGASIALSNKHRHVVMDNGLGLADSMSWDAHKWLFQTYACSLVLVKDKRLLIQSFATSAEYIQDAAEGGEEMPNFWNYGMELTRPGRGMKLWFFLQIVGLEKIGEMVDQGVAMAECAERELMGLDEWVIDSRAQLGIICFRFVPRQLQNQPEARDQLNQRVSAIAIEQNLAAPLTSRLGGRVVLRICSINPELKEGGMIDIIRGLDRIARSLLAQMQ